MYLLNFTYYSYAALILCYHKCA